MSTEATRAIHSTLDTNPGTLSCYQSLPWLTFPLTTEGFQSLEFILAAFIRDFDRAVIVTLV